MNYSNIKNFIKKHAFIPNTFIDDFFNIKFIQDNQTTPKINLDIVAKWLNVLKKNLLETLRSSYKNGIDYTIEKTSNRKINSKYGGNNYYKVLITPDCFKRICMLSRSKVAEDVRSYYIALEDLIFRYYKQTMDGMQSEIKKLEKARNPPRKNDKLAAGFIYIMKASETHDSVYKIGRSKNLQQRLSQYQTGKLDEVDIVFKFRTEDLVNMENCILGSIREKQIAKYREIYKIDIDLIKEIIKKCDEIQNLKKYYEMRKPSKLNGGWYLGFYKDLTN